MQNHTPDSSHIDHLAYELDTRTLHIRFRNKANTQAQPRTYTYANVPPHVFETMRTHPSAGQYFHAVIKKHYKLV